MPQVKEETKLVDAIRKALLQIRVEWHDADDMPQEYILSVGYKRPDGYIKVIRMIPLPESMQIKEE